MGRQIIQPVITALLWALATPAAAQDNTGAVIGAIDPAQPATAPADPGPPPCAYATAMTEPCGDVRPVTIGFRDNLGDAYGRIEDVIAAHPLVRIGWSTEFEVSRDLHEPDRHDREDGRIDQRRDNLPLDRLDRKSTRLNSSHVLRSRMPSSA